jgi:hypothetical protein
MVGLFAKQWRELRAEIVKASQHRDGPRLELAANRLRKSVDSLGAGDASRVAQVLEASGRGGDFRGVEKICASLQIEIERLVSDLKAYTQEMAPSSTDAWR